MATLWPIEDGRECPVPSAGRLVVRSLTPGSGAAFFDPMDPGDVDLFAWDFSIVGFPGDRIIAAGVSSDDAVAIGRPIVSGAVVQTFIGPASGHKRTIELKCSVVFQSGRIIDWDVEVGVQFL